MIKEAGIWVRKAEKGGSTVIREFASTIVRLPIYPEDIKGKILIGGIGQAFPERLFLCTPESFFEQIIVGIDVGIELIICCDPDFCTNPKNFIENPVVELSPEGRLELVAGVGYYPASLQEVLPSIPPDTFDVLMFFGITDMQEQLRKGLLGDIRRVLKGNGIFIGSGDFENLKVAKMILGEGFSSRSIISLPNPDYFGFLYRTHVGFVLKKERITDEFSSRVFEGACAAY